jgi:hypothetical protein
MVRLKPDTTYVGACLAGARIGPRRAERAKPGPPPRGLCAVRWKRYCQLGKGIPHRNIKGSALG